MMYSKTHSYELYHRNSIYIKSWNCSILKYLQMWAFKINKACLLNTKMI